MRGGVLFCSIRTYESLNVLQLLTSAVDGSNFRHVVILPCHIYVEILPFLLIFNFLETPGVQFHTKVSVSRPI